MEPSQSKSKSGAGSAAPVDLEEGHSGFPFETVDHPAAPKLPPKSNRPPPPPPTKKSTGAPDFDGRHVITLAQDLGGPLSFRDLEVKIFDFVEGKKIAKSMGRIPGAGHLVKVFGPINWEPGMQIDFKGPNSPLSLYSGMLCTTVEIGKGDEILLYLGDTEGMSRLVFSVTAPPRVAGVVVLEKRGD